MHRQKSVMTQWYNDTLHTKRERESNYTTFDTWKIKKAKNLQIRICIWLVEIELFLWLQAILIQPLTLHTFIWVHFGVVSSTLLWVEVDNIIAVDLFSQHVGNCGGQEAVAIINLTRWTIASELSREVARYFKYKANKKQYLLHSPGSSRLILSFSCSFPEIHSSPLSIGHTDWVQNCFTRNFEWRY